MTNAGKFAAETDRNVHLQAELPFLEFAAVEHSEGGRARNIEVTMVLVDQFVAQAEPAVTADCVESRQQEVACRNQLEFAPFDFPLLATDFHAARERFAMDAGPIECN